jgi:hypothetical protein
LEHEHDSTIRRGNINFVPKQYDPNALLYRWLYREDDGLPQLIGTDPELADRSKFFRWVDEPNGWEKRIPWSQGAVNVEPLANSAGFASGWPGALPIRAKPGRPRKEVADDDRPVTVSLSVRRSEIFEIQNLASSARKTVSEWLGGVVRAELERVAKNQVPPHEDAR